MGLAAVQTEDTPSGNVGRSHGHAHTNGIYRSQLRGLRPALSQQAVMTVNKSDEEIFRVPVNGLLRCQC